MIIETHEWRVRSGLARLFRAGSEQNARASAGGRGVGGRCQRVGTGGDGVRGLVGAADVDAAGRCGADAGIDEDGRQDLRLDGVGGRRDEGDEDLVRGPSLAGEIVGGGPAGCGAGDLRDVRAGGGVEVDGGAVASNFPMETKDL